MWNHTYSNWKLNSSMEASLSGVFTIKNVWYVFDFHPLVCFKYVYAVYVKKREQNVGYKIDISAWYFKHEYLRSRAYICLSLSSPSSSSGDISIKSWTIEILVLTSWIPASKNFRNVGDLGTIPYFYGTTLWTKAT